MCSVQNNCFWTLSLIFVGLSQITHAAWLRCYKGSLDNYLATPLDNPLQLATSSCIDRSLPTIIYTFGYRGRVAGPATTAILGAYLATRKRNVILLDWEEEARSGLLGISLGYMLYAVPNAKKIGKQMGEALEKLAGTGINMTQIHLLGHSLGAHIMAFAGRKTRESGHVISRITGLDPARAFFEGSLAIQTGLDRTCARFVDIIHSDPGGYGTSNPTGTVDIWPNYVGRKGTQPGCPKGDFEMFSPEDLCSHDRSWRYFVEAIASPTAFRASAATDYESWLANTGRKAAETIYMGDLISTRARGNYFLTTDSKSPYGKGEDGLRPDNNEIRRRRNPAFTRLFNHFR